MDVDTIASFIVIILISIFRKRFLSSLWSLIEVTDRDAVFTSIGGRDQHNVGC